MKLYIVISSTEQQLGYIGTDPNYAKTLTKPSLGGDWLTYAVEAEGQ